MCHSRILSPSKASEPPTLFPLHLPRAEMFALQRSDENEPERKILLARSASRVQHRLLTCEDIDDFTDIKFVSSIVLKFIGVSSKYLWVFLESLQQSSDIFRNFRKFSENVWECSPGLRNKLKNFLEIFGKSSETASSVRLYNIKNITH